MDYKDLSPLTNETARYLGYKKNSDITPSVLSLINKAQDEMIKLIKAQGVYEIFDISSCKLIDNSGNKPTYRISFADLSIDTKDLGWNLKDCKKVCLLAGTIGPQIDNYIRKQSMLDPAFGSICQATGAMYIELFIDNLNTHIKYLATKEGLKTMPRYSPGYGDVPLSFQKDFFRLLNCKRIGLSLMDSLIMAPEKSVTAFIGLKE